MGTTSTEYESTTPLETMRQRLTALYQNTHSNSPKGSAAPWDCHHAIQVLQIVSEMVSATMDEEQHIDNEITIIHVHPSGDLLRNLGSALNELDLGSVDPRLKPSGGGSGRRYSKLETAQVEKFLNFAKILRSARGMTHKQADIAVAKAAQKIGLSFRGAPVKAKTIAGWRRERPGERS
jgi:hypothetical protein